MPSRELCNWLLALADPAGVREPLPKEPLPVRALAELRTLAEQHTVLPAVANHLRLVAAEHGPGRLVRVRKKKDSPEKALNAFLSDTSNRLAALGGFSLLIRTQAAQVGAALADAGLPTLLLKGADFADRLYPDPAMRPFTDLDLLVPMSAIEQIRNVMRQLGYELARAAMKYDTGYGEESWVRPHSPGRPVELHWNLVNSPSVREGVSVAFEDVRTEPVTPRTIWRVPTSGSRLLIAAVHAAASHAFDRLALLYDVAQAARGAAGPIDEAQLTEDAARTGASFSLTAALTLAARVPREPACLELLERLKLPPRGGLWKLCLTRGVLLRRHAWRDSFRRQMFREMLKKK